MDVDVLPATQGRVLSTEDSRFCQRSEVRGLVRQMEEEELRVCPEEKPFPSLSAADRAFPGQSCALRWNLVTGLH